MSTLNSGMIVRNEKLSEETRALIDEALAGKVKVHVLQPAGTSGNEVSRSTRERIAEARRNFRKNQKTQK